MGVMHKTNGFMEKWIAVIMPLIMVTGIFLGSALSHLTSWTSFLFMVLTFVSAINANYRKFFKLFQKPLLLVTFLIVIHMLIPLVVFQSAHAVFAAQPGLVAGITLSVLLPLGVTSIFWVSYNKGDLETTLSLVSLDTLLSPFIVPLTFSFILGSQVSMDTESLIISLVKLVLLPTILGMLLGEWLRTKDAHSIAWFKPSAAIVSKGCLYVIVLLNAASISGQLSVVKGHFVQLLLAVMCTMVFGYLISYLLGKIFATDNQTRIAIAYSGGVRNYTVGVVLAAAFFEPIVGFPVLIAMLLQHPLALLFYYIFRWFNSSNRVYSTSSIEGER
ncbi:hypothetical protein L1N85_23055 [Paenibacillus alkaliterrae]|uniref:bile acid:sodium symporter family protein n=1 Tax=Paenibacillus alkaliterrae TaxID=320909 RepID=UPI001F29DFC3|nr:hypothetical protein [Paenibacillus alkaliterrae]MCF2941250.1 hypothetical protein [Paenibacillus alkaliterrae]